MALALKMKTLKAETHLVAILGSTFAILESRNIESRAATFESGILESKVALLRVERRSATRIARGNSRLLIGFPILRPMAGEERALKSTRTGSGEKVKSVEMVV